MEDQDIPLELLWKGGLWGVVAGKGASYARFAFNVLDSRLSPNVPGNRLARAP
jgi:hypothetical protein